MDYAQISAYGELKMTNILRVNGSIPLGSQVASTRDTLVQLMNAAVVLSAQCAQCVGDDATGAQLQALLGTDTPANALAINTLLGSLNTNLQNAGNSFLGFQSRITRI